MWDRNGFAASSADRAGGWDWPTASPGPAGPELVRIASETLEALARRSREIEDRSARLVDHFRQVTARAESEIERIRDEGWVLSHRHAELQQEIAERERHYRNEIAERERQIADYRSAVDMLRGWILDLETEMSRALPAAARTVSPAASRGPYGTGRSTGDRAPRLSSAR